MLDDMKKTNVKVLYITPVQTFMLHACYDKTLNGGLPVLLSDKNKEYTKHKHTLRVITDMW